MVKNTLYYENAYIEKFESIVKECIKENEKIKVVLENTAFYPEGGGQPSDTGVIDDVKVFRVEEKNSKIFHIVEKEIPVGKKVKCNINFKERFINMQNHTAEHIVSGLICKNFDATNVGFHIGADFTTMDFNKNLSADDMKRIEILANEAIYENIEVKTKIYENREVKNLSYRSKIDLKEDVRLVEIKGYDICACCGVHVSRTGEIGIIKLVKLEKYKSGVRIYMLVGIKALEDYDNKYNQIDKISTLLSLKLDEVYDGVLNLTTEIDSLKKERNLLKSKIFENEIALFEIKDNIVVEKENFSMNDMKNYCLKLKLKAKKVSAVISDGKFIMMSDTEDLKQVFESLKIKVNLQGGGSNLVFQGKIIDDIEKFKKAIYEI